MVKKKIIFSFLSIILSIFYECPCVRLCIDLVLNGTVFSSFFLFFIIIFSIVKNLVFFYSRFVRLHIFTLDHSNFSYFFSFSHSIYHNVSLFIVWSFIRTLFWAQICIDVVNFSWKMKMKVQKKITTESINRLLGKIRLSAVHFCILMWYSLLFFFSFFFVYILHYFSVSVCIFFSFGSFFALWISSHALFLSIQH